MRKRLDLIKSKLLPAKEKKLAELKAKAHPTSKDTASIAKLTTDIQDLKDEATLLQKQLDEQHGDATDYLSGKGGSTTTNYTPDHYTGSSNTLPGATGEEGVGAGSDYSVENDAKIQKLWTVGGATAGVILLVIAAVALAKKRKKK